MLSDDNLEGEGVLISSLDSENEGGKGRASLGGCHVRVEESVEQSFRAPVLEGGGAPQCVQETEQGRGAYDSDLREVVPVDKAAS